MRPNKRMRKEDEQKKEISRKEIFSFLALIPFAVFYGCKFLDDSFWRFLINSAAAWVIYAVVFGIALVAFESFSDKRAFIFKNIVVAVVLAFATICIHGLIY